MPYSCRWQEYGIFFSGKSSWKMSLATGAEKDAVSM